MINDARLKINEIDDKILKLLEKRFELCKEIGDYKKQNNLRVEDLQREKEVLDDRLSKTSLSQEFVEALFDLIFKESKKIQESR